MMEEVDRKPYPSADGLTNIQRFMKTISPKLAELKIDESGFIDPSLPPEQNDARSEVLMRSSVIVDNGDCKTWP